MALPARSRWMSAPRVARAAGAVAVGLAALVLLGWAIGSDALVAPWPGLGSMKANTALSLGLVGASILLRTRESPSARALALAACLLAAALAVVTLAEYATGIDMRIDTLLARDPRALLTTSPGRMSPLTAVILLSLSVEAVCAPSRRRGVRAFADVLLVIVGVLMLAALAGYTFGVQPFYGASRFTTGIAPHTLFAIAAIFVGEIALRPDTTMARHLGSTTTAGRFMRRALVVALLVPIVTIAVILQGEKLGWYDSSFRASLAVVTTTTLLALFAWAAGRRIERADQERDAAARAVEQNRNDLERAVEARTRELSERERFQSALLEAQSDLGEGLSIVEDERFVYANPALCSMVGRTSEEILAMPTMTDLVHPSARASIAPLVEAWAATGSVVPKLVTTLQHKDGSPIHAELSVKLLPGPKRQAITLMREITSRRRAEEALQRSEARHRALLGSATDAIVTADHDGLLTYVNAAATRMFQRSEADLLGRPITDLMPARFREAHLAGLDRYHRTRTGRILGTTVELSAIRADGTEFPIEISLAAWDEKGKSQFGAIVRDVSERVRHEEELREALEAAEAGTRAKSAFLASMSHEIRTPMTSVLGMASILEGTDLTPQQREYLQTIKTSGDHLLELINDILDFSRIEAGRLTLRASPFDPRALVHDAVELVRPSAAAKGLAVKVEVDPELPSLLVGDEGRLRQVLVNLLGNAVKFTAHGEVEVRVRSERFGDQRARLGIDVRDTGIGMSPEQLGRLFQPFRQGDEGITRRYGGTGLGLSISQRLMTLMGGRISAVSTPQMGSTFHVEVTLPVHATIAPPTVAGSSSRARRLRILVAEDIAANRAVVEVMLSRMGHDVAFATNGKEAVEAAKAGGFDVILMDVQMPVMDGYEATRQIRALLPRARQPKIVALTAGAFEEEIKRALESGMDAYLTKPYYPEMLEKALAGVRPRADVGGHDVVMDRATVDRLKASLGGDPEVVRHVAQLVRGSADELFPKLDEAAAHADAEEAARVAHQLRGQLRTIGGIEVSDICARIESAAHAGSPADLRDLAHDAREAYARFLPALHDLEEE